MENEKEPIHPDLAQMAMLPEVKKAYISRNGKHLELENYHGTVLIVSVVWKPSYLSYEISIPIKPNLKTGSSIGLTEDYFNADFNEAIEIIKNAKNSMPQFFSQEQRESVEFLTIEQSVNWHDNILGYYQIKPEKGGQK